MTRGSRVLARGRSGIVDSVARFADCAVWTIVGFSTSPEVLRIVTPFDRLASARIAWRWRRCEAASAAAAVSRAVCAVAMPGCGVAGGDLVLRGWQRVVARAFDEGLAARVLLADGVGLGKTVQAGFAMASLIARRPEARVLVATPAGLRDQWRAELKRLFDLDAAVLDPPAVRRLRRERPRWANAWAAHRVVITSIDYLKQPEACAAALRVPWDLFVADEAHVLAPATDRHAAADAIARVAGRVLLVTATPHAGDDRAFDTLCRVGAPAAAVDPILFVRRARADVSVVSRRRVRTRRVAGSPRERALHERLLSYTSRVWTQGTGEPASRLAMTVLLRRAASSASALARSLRFRRACLARDAIQSWVQPALPFVEDGEADDADDALPDALAVPGLADREVELEELDHLASAAEACAGGDSKLRALARLVRRVREPLVVFTEYRDTLHAIELALTGKCATAVLHGGLGRAARQQAERRFTGGAARVLLATDVAAEGLNLHHAARAVVNVELPWSPARLEQRIGRVDRLGQQRTVHVSNLVWETGVEDAVLRRLEVRLASMRAALPDGVPPLGAGTDADADQSRRADDPARSRHYTTLEPVKDDDTAWVERVRALQAPPAHRLAAIRRCDRADSSIPLARIRPWPALAAGRSGIAFVFRAQRACSSGSLAAEAVVSVFVACDREALGRHALRESLATAVAAATAEARESASPALDDGVARHRRRTEAQLRRARGTDPAGGLDKRRDPLVQVGLFDRRALSRAARIRAAQDAIERQRRERIAGLERDLLLDPEVTLVPVAAFVVR